jgi:hypothetical protein
MHEKTGIFSVRSAYSLAVRLEAEEQNQTSCSSHADGSRPVFQAIWSAVVPPKVKIFAWRLSQEALATQTNRKARTLEKEAACQVCGKEDESGYHAVVQCSQTSALRREMRKHWVLPEESMFMFSGPDWLLHLLGAVGHDERNYTLLVLSRAWHHRNDIMHGKEQATIWGSVEFLTSYALPLNIAGQAHSEGISEKGKEKIHEGVAREPWFQEARTDKHGHQAKQVGRR